MNQLINIALVGAGGYGHFYLRALAEEAAAHQVTFVGVIDPTLGGSPLEAELRNAQLPIYPDLASCLQQTAVQLLAIAAPIHLHAPYTQSALAHGIHVLCEKPLCATLQEATQMRESQQRHGGIVAIGYQWSFSAAIGALKQDILAGRLGQPRRVKASVLWPRTAAYYARNQWAGRLQMPDGRWVLDSPVNNATAHYLHNLFYLLGDHPTTSAQPVTVQAELYRANPIENCDTAALRCRTGAGVEILYYASHAIPTIAGPQFHLEFDEASVTYPNGGTPNGGTPNGGTIVATFANGQQKNYGDPFADDTRKLWQTVDAIRTGAPVACDLQAATAHVRAINGMHESMPVVTDFPTELVQQENDLTWVSGLQETLAASYAQNCLPSELGTAAWARPGQVITMDAYTHFPQSPTWPK
ncbi:MAG: Gfo/Idh/MocA family oxidoreductase [Caldilineaceae bacterium]|nr:Gfo/Idh/MocA family oxidoreductase [Caldilineaceae bacterium]